VFNINFVKPLKNPTSKKQEGDFLFIRLRLVVPHFVCCSISWYSFFTLFFFLWFWNLGQFSFGLDKGIAKKKTWKKYFGWKK